MHREAMDWLRTFRNVAAAEPRVVEFGSRDVNGTARVLFPDAWEYVGIDTSPGRCVDIVADARLWIPADGKLFDVCLCTEMLEHSPDPQLVVANTARVLHPGGVLLLTCAGPRREPHGSDGGPLPEGEHYQNIHPGELAGWLREHFKGVWVEDREGVDVYAVGVKGR